MLPCDRTGQNPKSINAGDLKVRLWVGYQRFEKTLGTILSGLLAAVISSRGNKLLQAWLGTAERED
ncbi:hypothetical protein AWN88_01870 [Agrobacterium tumefaciens]|nr:hypothetical protein AWN88_01870 [Agrobacterium tumefaciens]KAJ34370.1 hypothetical protein BW45_04340 [Agrobacterium tumefaciens]